jgi:N-acetylglucosaminyldiphosphoundecaprenol N-acetyl-beta-D-mannosaminyltransferase
MKILPIKRILGTTFNPLSLDDATELVMCWAHGQDKSKYVIQGNVYTVMNALDNVDYKKTVGDASLVLPDGQPISWVNRLKGSSIRNNVRGFDLMMHCLHYSLHQDVRHFFYGGKQEILDKLEQKMVSQFSGVSLAGVYSPPFRQLSQSEDEEICRMINKSGADILWVGLGAPKQDIWMQQHRGKLNVKVMIGVGAAFDFFVGNVKQAPVFMQKLGLEWLHRLCQEPGRLWARYLINNPRFIYYNLLEFLKLRKFVSILAATGILFFTLFGLGYCKNIANFNNSACQNNLQRDDVTNLIENGSFEAGLDRWGVSLSENSSSYEMLICASDIQPAIVTDVKVPDKRSLQLTIPEHATVTLTSGYFSVPHTGEYVLSCYLRANVLNPLHVSLGISPYYFGNDNYASQDFSVGRGWKKYLIKSRLDASKNMQYFVKIASDNPGILWVDNVELSQKDTANFVPAKNAEVGFERRESSVFSSKEEIGLLLDIYAYKSEKAKLQVSSTDFWGSRSVLYDQPLNLKAGEFRRVKIVHSSLKTGYYLVKAELRTMEKAGDIAETAIGIIPIIQPGEIIKSPFGGHVFFNKDRLQEASLLGIQWLRMHPPSGTKWFIVEKGKNKFIYPDKEIKLAKDMGFAILGSLDTTPRWASSAPANLKDEWSNGYRSFMPKNIKDWKRYVSNTVLHYKDIIDYWEIWNEPDSEFFHNLGGNSQRAKDYVLLLKAGYVAAKSANPHCVIVGGVGCRQPFDQWLEAIAREGALDYLDIVSFHGYLSDENAFGDESAVRKSVRAIKEVIRKYGKGRMIPVWDTESGVMFIQSSYTNIKEVFPEFPMNGRDGPGYVVRRMVDLLTSGVEKWFYYSLISSNRSDRKECMGFFDWDNTPRPLAVAYAVMVSLIGDKHFIREMVLNKKVYCAEFKGNNEQRLKVLWTKNKEKTVDIDVGDASLVKVIDIMGNEVKKIAIGKNRIKILLSKNPVYVLE